MPESEQVRVLKEEVRLKEERIFNLEQAMDAQRKMLKYYQKLFLDLKWEKPSIERK